ncbi:LuxR C-terminal-related transcriptional regulator [Limnohabitans sp.]|uniref:helix-turn-helix transcriptional regulator n=1 Tax=Limnohabitans sp. TaxID=1907725 RepID=UPI00286F4AB7|nr:LuxR C-terminal-related transcriptional regulator [Limnohabitans sp.]
MYLTGKQMRLISKIMQVFTESHNEKEIREIVGDLVMQLLQAQYYASFVWQDDSASFASAIQINMDPANIQQYENYYQFNDPITPLMKRYEVAVRATDVLKQEELIKTEFYNDFLKKDGLCWGVNLYAWQRGRNLGDMRIWRDSRRNNFSEDDLRMLDMIQPAFTNALARAREYAEPRNATPSLIISLSPREQETAQLVAQGLSDKEIARHLNIATTTVRTHLENAFRKTGASNRAGLAHKILS